MYVMFEIKKGNPNRYIFKQKILVTEKMGYITCRFVIKKKCITANSQHEIRETQEKKGNSLLVFQKTINVYGSPVCRWSSKG